MLVDIEYRGELEVVTLTAVAGNVITANFLNPHAGASIPVDGFSGSFGTGIIPPAAAPTNYPNGSTDTSSSCTATSTATARFFTRVHLRAGNQHCSGIPLPQPNVVHRRGETRAGSFHVFADHRSQQSRHTRALPTSQQANGLSFVTDVAVT